MSHTIEVNSDKFSNVKKKEKKKPSKGHGFDLYIIVVFHPILWVIVQI